MTWLDLVLVLVGMLITAILIRLIQSRNVEGLVGVMDLIIPHKDPRERILSLSLTVGVPLLVGGILSYFADNTLGVAMMGPGLGAFTSVSTAFFRPDTLLKSVQKHLLAAQITYFSFVAGYAVLGALAAVLTTIAVRYFREGDVINNMAASLFGWMIAALATRGIAWLSTAGLKQPEAAPLNPQVITEIGTLIQQEVHTAFRTIALEMGAAVMPGGEESAVLNEALKKAVREAIREEFQSLGSGEVVAGLEGASGKEQTLQTVDVSTIREIIREEVRMAAARQALHEAETQRTMNVHRVSEEHNVYDFYQSGDSVDNPTPIEKTQLAWSAPRYPNQKGYYYRFRFGPRGIFG